MIGIGIIGCGGMGAWHAANLAKQSNLRVVAFADVNADAAGQVAERLGGRVQPGLELVTADDVDAVVIASSDESHAEYVEAAMAAGRYCFLEKPLADTIERAKIILDAEIEAGRQLVRLGFMRELDPAHVELAESLGDLGAITKIRCVHRNVDQEPRPVELLFAQSLIHDIHSIRWLSGCEIVSTQVHVVERSDGFRDLLMLCHLEGGGLATVEFEDQGFAYEVQAEVTAMGGMVATLPHPRAVVRAGGNESLPVGADWFGRFAEAYRLEMEEWAATLHDGVHRGPSVWDGYTAQLVADAGRRSMVSGQEVAVDVPKRPRLYPRRS